MKVALLSHTPEPEKVVAIAARLCYSNKVDIETIANGLTNAEIAKFVKQIVSVNHASVLEHCSFTFGIEGISRALTHEIVRHRIASYSQRSQRYCAEEKCEMIIPNDPTLEGKVMTMYLKGIEYPRRYYKELLDVEVPKEIARYVLPNATASRIIVTMNARSLLHFFNLRCCNRAMKEMRDLANKMLELVKPIAPNIFANAGASCVTLGYCPEGKRCCGKAPTLEMLKDAYYKKGE